MSNDRPGDAQVAVELARLAPPPAERDLLPSSHRAIKAAVMAGITRTDGARSPRLLPLGGRRVTGRTALVVAVIAALAAVAASVIPGLTHSPSHISAPPAAVSDTQAVRLLARVADLAGRRASPAVADTDYVYVETVQAFTHGNARIGPDGTIQQGRADSAAGLPQPRQVWIPVADLCRKGLLRQGGRDITLTTQGVTCPFAGSLNDPTYRLLASLPNDPRALLARIYADTKGAGANPDQEAFVTIGDLLRESIAPPEVTAALYRAAARIPGVTFVRNATDAAGRRGVAVARSDGTTVSQWIFSTTTDEFLGERDVLAKDTPGLGNAGQVVGTTAVLAKAIVTSIGKTA